MEAHQASNKICKVRLHILRINTSWFLEDIIHSGNEVFREFESDTQVGPQMLHTWTWETVKKYVIVKYNTAS